MTRIYVDRPLNTVSEARATERVRTRAAISIVLLLLLAGAPVLLSKMARRDAEREPFEESVQEAEEAADATQKVRTLERSAIPREVLERMRTVAAPVGYANAPEMDGEQVVAVPAVARRRSLPEVEDGPGEKAGDSRVATDGEDRGTAVLDIEVDGRRLDQVAAHFGYALAAFYLSEGDTALLGFFEGDRLRYPDLEELQGFSGRGRSAERLPDRDLYEKIAARQSGVESSRVRLLFLVPRDVDERWLRWQREVVGRHGYRFDEVVEVRARYGENFELVACALVLRNGGVSSLEGGGL